MYVMTVPKINSYLGTLECYESMFADDFLTVRATPKQANDIVLYKTGLFSYIRFYERQGTKFYSSYCSLETPSISQKDTLENELNRKVSGKEIQPILEQIEEKMIKNQQQSTPKFQVIHPKFASL